jgi:hypothetical protein
VREAIYGIFAIRRWPDSRIGLFDQRSGNVSLCHYELHLSYQSPFVIFQYDYSMTLQLLLCIAHVVLPPFAKGSPIDYSVHFIVA